MVLINFKTPKSATSTFKRHRKAIHFPQTNAATRRDTGSTLREEVESAGKLRVQTASSKSMNMSQKQIKTNNLLNCKKPKARCLIGQ